jgi:hypothetical protein
MPHILCAVCTSTSFSCTITSCQSYSRVSTALCTSPQEVEIKQSSSSSSKCFRFPSCFVLFCVQKVTPITHQCFAKRRRQRYALRGTRRVTANRKSRRLDWTTMMCLGLAACPALRIELEARFSLPFYTTCACRTTCYPFPCVSEQRKHHRQPVTLRSVCRCIFVAHSITTRRLG